MWFEVKKGSITLWDEELFQYHILQVQTWPFLRQARIFFSQFLNQFNHSVIKSWYQIISIIKIFSLFLNLLKALLLIKQEYKMYTPNDLIPSIFPISLEMPLGSHLRWLVPSNFSSTTTSSIPCQLISLPWTVTIYTASTNLRCLHV